MTAIVALAASAPGERLVSALVDGTTIRIPCPRWCMADHVAEGVRFMQDIEHHSTPVSVQAPVGIDSTESILSAHVNRCPFLGGERSGTVFAIDATGSGDYAELNKTQATQFLDQLEAHLLALRAEVSQMKEVA